MSGIAMAEHDIDPVYRTREANKSVALVDVIKDEIRMPIDDILVVGCGSGREAGLLARLLKSRTVGIDIGGEFSFDRVGSAPARLIEMDARELQFPDGTFDFVFSFHALEHIPHPEKALAEMARVLRSGGTYLIGTPNKHRLIGYMGSPTSIKDKILWNFADFKKRLKGEWSNEAGAHAGFTQQELFDLCSAAFGSNPISVSGQYYSRLYGRLATGLSLTGMHSVIFPCVYVMGKKA
ncbi:class I SAM-dependent methyltransferase [Bradyrhizobium sp. AUGA SZCCT0158]|uniref:class I SAM-dependent methyltransferase n=1 Tax=Bradyrhizobium sp. AUGA SZCCT0158 TaxID=2807661 RepID=UPI001BAE2677|nr:class I SAM-dependent methyltransferase [Bradyrhizobium sp. AUGA SZCCT0158]MBR1197420.1 class I SAM-dependent methyltransferase [Bradyrhizobium sp. AUGA SZCCT0158]